MRSLVIGMGEVGQGVFKVLQGQEKYVLARDKDPLVISDKIDALHICIPYSDSFKNAVSSYVKLYSPKLVIVYSTVPIGTCEELQVVHSPVEGKHPAIGLSIQNMARWVGSSNEKMLKEAIKFWEKYVPVRNVPSASFTEWLKMRSTSKYGINLVWAQYEAEVCEELGMDFVAVKQFDVDYNNLYQRLGMLQFQRYLLDPPEGKIGGHCVVPNAKLLNKQFPNALLEMIIAMEEKK